MQRFEAFWVKVLRISAAANGVVVLLLAVMITTDVLVRWTTGRPIIGVFEIAEILFVPIIFMVIGLAQFTDRQLRVDALSGLARGRLATGLRAFDQSLGLVFFGILLWTGWENWLAAIQGSYLGRGMLGIPTAVPLGFLVFGTFLMCVTLVLMLVKSIYQTATGATEDVSRSQDPTQTGF